MEFVRGNKAVRDAAAEGRELHLFEESRDGFLRYLGSAECIDWHYAPAPDRDGNMRRAIVFELLVGGTAGDVTVAAAGATVETSQRALAQKSLAELRDLAIKRPPREASVSTRRAYVYQRSAAVKLYVRRRANGRCEACQQPAPFVSKSGEPFLEPHHTKRVADGGPDHPRWVAAVCPNCHRRVHYGKDGERYNRALMRFLSTIESDDDEPSAAVGM